MIEILKKKYGRLLKIFSDRGFIFSEDSYLKLTRSNFDDNGRYYTSVVFKIKLIFELDTKQKFQVKILRWIRKD